MKEDKEGGEQKQKGFIESYKDWMLSGLFFPLKILYTGMWIASMFTFQIKETIVLWVVGIIFVFGKDEIKKWEIQLDEDENL